MKNTKEPKKSAPALIGTISLTSKGVGYVRLSASLEDDIEIENRFLRTALHGDTIELLLHPRRPKQRTTGEVVSIISRAKAGFAGTLIVEGDTLVLDADDQKLYTSILVPKANLHGAKAGEKVFVKIISWQDPKKLPLGEVAQILGAPGEHEAEIAAISLEKGFNSLFPKDVVDESERLDHKMPDISSRRDFRTTPTFTIDPFDAKDFDDALSVLKLPDGKFEIGIHIADVSHYVRPGSAIDKEAFKRATSVYLVDRTIPMLPEILSNDLASLKPDVDRLTMSAVFIMDIHGAIHGEWYGKSIIHSDKRFTYEGAQEILDAKQGEFYSELHTLNKLAKILEKNRLADGALVLETEEVKFELDKKGVPIAVYKKVRGDTHKLVEEFMLLANRKVAEFITKKSKKNIFIYRVHDLPDPDKLADLKSFLSQLGHKISGTGKVLLAKDLSTFLKRIASHPEKSMIEMTIVRSMAKAVYSTTNIGHYGLAFKHYTHFTSPIRRYPDLAVHRLLESYLSGHSPKPESIKTYDEISRHSSVQEKKAAEAERASVKYKQVEYMSKRIGTTLTGTISGVTDWGLYVEEKETKSEGMIPIRNLGAEYFTFDKTKMAIIGQKTRTRYRLGDTIRISVAEANLGTKTITYALA